jgi:hypothetical protein
VSAVTFCTHASHPAPVEVPDAVFFGHVRSAHRRDWLNIADGRLYPDVDAMVAALRKAADDLDAFSYARANAIATLRIAAATLDAYAPPLVVLVERLRTDGHNETGQIGLYARSLLALLDTSAVSR